MSSILNKTLQIQGMTCISCENRINRALLSNEGIKNAKADYTSGTVNFSFDEKIISIGEVINIIEQLDYKVERTEKKDAPKAGQRPDITKILSVSIILVALYMLISRFGGFNIFNAFPQAEEGMGYGMLFIIGLLTSIHCVAMCGGINISQCVPVNITDTAVKSKRSTLSPSILYNTGRVISYTIVGGIIGALGSVFSFSGTAKGIIQLAAGIFMVIMGLNMLNIFPWLRKFNPRMPKIFARKINEQKSGKGPLIVGLLNGFMPCGPLQAMQLYALSTGSPLKGALSMLIFSLGTVPLMFGLGALSSFLRKKFTNKMMVVSAVLVVVLGVSMFSSGIVLSGFSFPSININTSGGTQNGNTAVISDNVQFITTKLSSGRYEPITVQKGITVKWIIQAQDKDINGCNNEIIIPEFGKDVKLASGDNVIEFTPTESGSYAYSCWMGMIRSKITVVDNINNNAASSSDSGSNTSVYKIPVDNIAVAEIKDGKQYISIEVAADRFTPAIVVVEKDMETVWNINGVEIDENNNTLIFPAYNVQVSIQKGENPIYLVPDDDFDFSTINNTFYGYVKVVDDISKIDTDAIKAEVGKHVPVAQEFVDDSGLPKCH